jgi:hypothetical protein
VDADKDGRRGVVDEGRTRQGGAFNEGYFDAREGVAVDSAAYGHDARLRHMYCFGYERGLRERELEKAVSGPV